MNDKVEDVFFFGLVVFACVLTFMPVAVITWAIIRLVIHFTT